MKKSPLVYFTTVFLLLVFAGATILPGFINNQEIKSCISINKEKAEKENREKESSEEGTAKEYFPDFFFLFQHADHISPDKLKHREMNVSFFQSCFLPVLTPPPDNI